MKSLSFLFLFLLAIFTFPLSAQAEICGVFHKKINDVCIHFDVPSNAHLTYSGNSWDCNRGFRPSSDQKSCEEVRIVNNASANWIGSFNCNSGFRKQDNECIRFPDIENGKFYEQGADFYCSSGYHRNESERKCEKIIIPQHAREDSSNLDGWRCFSGYIKEGSGCKEFKLPEHAFWFIDFWGCEPGYRKNSDNKSCDKIFIPENAHSADTFDGWLCNPGYTKNYKENHCEKS